MKEGSTGKNSELSEAKLAVQAQLKSSQADSLWVCNLTCSESCRDSTLSPGAVNVSIDLLHKGTH